ncbi:hypothetical protein CMV30_10865 [Nibricoccus aquaticus]|uniref:Uncharacterized protein n=1 Tax=Nibricoccus aquaticus TaxID=2576891 RepID=A0A290QDU1_9BACT|nr:hypothetical protein CMV30_10865 [Nibricoccus aquaticus]
MPVSPSFKSCRPSVTVNTSPPTPTFPAHSTTTSSSSAYFSSNPVRPENVFAADVCVQYRGSATALTRIVTPSTGFHAAHARVLSRR